MDTLTAFILGQTNRGNELMVFDWEKAAHLIKDRQPLIASAGLQSDWEWTGGTIWANGAPVPQNETYTYLASTWATPELDLDGEIIPCFRMISDSPGWTHATYWPPEALSIIS